MKRQRRIDGKTLQRLSDVQETGRNALEDFSLTGTLEQRPFGRTGEKVSVIGLGGAALHKHSYQHGLATVKHALDLGVTYFDTSPAYGKRSPEGRWLAQGQTGPETPPNRVAVPRPFVPLIVAITLWLISRLSIQSNTAPQTKRGGHERTAPPVYA